MAQGPSDTILVAIRITLRIRESKVRNRDPPDRRRFVVSEHILLYLYFAPLSRYYRLFPKISRDHVTTTNLIRPTTCLENLKTVASVVSELWLVTLKFKTGHVTRPRSFQERFIVRRLGLNTINLSAKYEVSKFTHYTKIRKTTKNVEVVFGG